MKRPVEPLETLHAAWCRAFEEADPRATTVRLTERLRDVHGDRLRRGSPVASWRPNVALRPTFVAAGQVMVFVKGCRNPDPMHEATMMAGRGVLCRSDRRVVVVGDGRLGKAPELISRCGAAVRTPDRLPEVPSADGNAVT